MSGNGMINVKSDQKQVTFLNQQKVVAQSNMTEKNSEVVRLPEDINIRTLKDRDFKVKGSKDKLQFGNKEVLKRFQELQRYSQKERQELTIEQEEECTIQNSNQSEYHQLEEILSRQQALKQENKLQGEEHKQQLLQYNTEELQRTRGSLKQMVKINQELSRRNQQLSDRLNQFELKVKVLREEMGRKEQQNTQARSKADNYIESIEKELGYLKPSQRVRSVAETNKDQDVYMLNKRVEELQTLISEQNSNYKSLTFMLASKSKQIDTLETSNGVLRKQLIISINNEENSKRRRLQEKSRNRQSLRQMGPSRQKYFSRTTVYNQVQNSKDSALEINGSSWGNSARQWKNRAANINELSKTIVKTSEPIKLVQLT